MREKELKVIRIGNSRGIRLPADSLKRYRICESVVMEERTEGLFLHPAAPGIRKLTWEETANRMAAAREDWSDWNGVSADGLEDIPWEEGKRVPVGERRSRLIPKLKIGKK